MVCWAANGVVWSFDRLQQLVLMYMCIVMSMLFCCCSTRHEGTGSQQGRKSIMVRHGTLMLAGETAWFLRGGFGEVQGPTEQTSSAAGQPIWLILNYYC